MTSVIIKNFFILLVIPPKRFQQTFPISFGILWWARWRINSPRLRTVWENHHLHICSVATMASIQFLWNVLGQRRRVIESLCYAHPDRRRRVKPHSWPITMATVVSGTMWKKFEKRGRSTKAKRRRKADPNTYLKYAGGREHKQNLQWRPREAKRNTFSSLKEFSEQFFFPEYMKYNYFYPHCLQAFGWVLNSPLRRDTPKSLTVNFSVQGSKT